jgi:hypothetical protein
MVQIKLVKRPGLAYNYISREGLKLSGGVK